MLTASAFPERGRYDVGQYPVDPVTVPSEAEVVLVKALREHWADTGADVMSVSIDYSKDGGKSWKYFFGFKARGGEAIDAKTGKVSPFTQVQFPLPDEGLDGRMVRGTVDVYTPLVTSVTMEFK